MSQFDSPSGASECHAVITVNDYPVNSFISQLEAVTAALSRFGLERPELCPVFVRAFVSDGANQGKAVYTALSAAVPCAALSIVEQPPLNGAKLALWVYLRSNAEIHTLPWSMPAVSVNTHESDLSHIYMGSASVPGFGSEVATMTLLQDYALNLENIGMTLADNCIRTWFYVRDVDTNYAGMVRGRNEVFGSMGLTPQTHFIASTGIGGGDADTTASVMLDTYAIGNLAPGQQRYLYARDYLNSTYEYGVAFERGVAVDYADRRHLIISGTASIDNRGAVVHPGDIELQAERMLTNVEALLHEGGGSFDNCCHMIIYLRDVADYTRIARLFDERMPDMPRVIVLAPVCRPGWLIEMECMAIVPGQSAYAPF